MTTAPAEELASTVMSSGVPLLTGGVVSGTWILTVDGPRVVA